MIEVISQPSKKMKLNEENILPDIANQPHELIIKEQYIPEKNKEKTIEDNKSQPSFLELVVLSQSETSQNEIPKNPAFQVKI